jgi:Fe-S-cluster containining protein
MQQEGWRAAPESQGCAFLGSQGECRVYEARPYVCRTHGLALALQRGPVSVCSLNRGSLPKDASPESGQAYKSRAVWRLGPYEEKLAALQYRFQRSANLKRVLLRSLLPPP